MSHFSFVAVPSDRLAALCNRVNKTIHSEREETIAKRMKKQREADEASWWRKLFCRAPRSESELRAYVLDYENYPFSQSIALYNTLHYGDEASAIAAKLHEASKYADFVQVSVYDLNELNRWD